MRNRLGAAWGHSWEPEHNSVCAAELVVLAGYVAVGLLTFTDDRRRGQLFQKGKEAIGNAVANAKPLVEQAVDKAKAAAAK